LRRLDEVRTVIVLPVVTPCRTNVTIRLGLSHLTMKADPIAGDPNTASDPDAPSR
jgi:hypothetical protein